MHKKNKIDSVFLKLFFSFRIPFATVEHLKGLESSRAALLKIYCACESARGLIKKQIPIRRSGVGPKILHL